ncbi:hypothetical protein CGMCC3_g5411 [Colletotrichum fructicola]|nr:uncharacterized protein CGMCC3_g5411 [Colletotrichum fructicola]KAE9578267.1 hypothetical protein CGMCC3_g5411 [Colletotrichum fructicola]
MSILVSFASLCAPFASLDTLVLTWQALAASAVSVPRCGRRLRDVANDVLANDSVANDALASRG